MKTTTNETLPDKPSELIRLALHDLELCEQDDMYIINMRRWHVPSDTYGWHSPEKKCYVCLAGSVMAKSLNADALKYLDPWDYNGKTIIKLLALEQFRKGHVHKGIILLFPESFENMDLSKFYDYTFIISYEQKPTKFKQRMHQLADDLEREGL